jgi:hypothetical protein
VGQGRAKGDEGSSPRHSGDVGGRVMGAWARFDRAARHGRGHDGCGEGFGLTGRACSRVSEGRAGELANGADGMAPLGRERARLGAERWDPPVSGRGCADAGGRTGLNGPKGREGRGFGLLFLFFLFLNF